ncbi:MAG TPA: hypothetical protein VK688_07980 [Gemmatimonadales bacterium]|jgi:hypothetical protein|nr:hypothetical protein [Gemmatimonadales bacterium]
MTENGRLCRGDRGHGRGDRRRRALMLAILFIVGTELVIDGGMSQL